jgi:hypothetical protein
LFKAQACAECRAGLGPGEDWAIYQWGGGSYALHVGECERLKDFIRNTMLVAAPQN